MVKVKNKRNSGLADKVRNKRNAALNKKVINPFEVHINKEKFKVIGQKSKSDRGLPGVSRAKAILKRKETIGAEMKLLNKTNLFLDKRIGEKDSNISLEEKLTARFAMERAKMHTGKKSIFNLGDNEVLTHQGQTLEEIEKFDDPRSSDDEDDDGRKLAGGLSNKFVAEGHFGGGMLSKTDNKDGAKSHKDLIEQLIAESKKRKAEKQKAKEQTLDLTEKLDTDWKDLRPLVFKKPKLTEEGDSNIIESLLSKEEKRSQDYDTMMRELRFEKRGTPSDGLKSDEQIAKEQKEKLDKLEKERLERMHGIANNKNQTQKSKHRSAEDLDDNFDLDDQITDVMISYDKEGNPLVPEHILKDYAVEKRRNPNFNNRGDSSTDDEDDGQDENESSDEEEESSENDSLQDLKESDDESDESTPEMNMKESNVLEKIKAKSNVQVNVDKTLVKTKLSPKNIVDVEIKSESESSNSETSLKPQVPAHTTQESKLIKSESDTSEESEVKIDKSSMKEGSDSKVGTIKMKSNLMKVNSEFNASEVDETITARIRDDLQTRKEMMEKARNELPYTYEMPNKYEELEELLINQEPEYQAVVLERLLKCLHPSLAEKNKENLSMLFAYMLQYTNNIFSDLKTEKQISKSFKIFDKIAPFIYDLAQHNVMNAKQYITEVLIEKHAEFKKCPKNVPDLDTLMFLKLVSIIFPTSDFRHPVVSPALVFMSEILTKCKYVNLYTISRGLFVSSLVMEYTSLSKRFLPSCVNFLRGILFYCATTTVINQVRVVPPFKFFTDISNMLVLEENCADMKIVMPKMTCKELAAKKIDDTTKIRCFYTAVEMLKEVFTNCKELDALECMLEPHLLFLNRVELDNYPKSVAEKARELMSFMKDTFEVRTYSPLAREKPRPKALRLYEPDIQEVFTGTKSSKLPREQVERRKLQYRYKQERKGALREIRRDKSYIASVKIRDRLQSDNLRMEKVKQIYKDASIQQGELNKLKRQK